MTGETTATWGSLRTTSAIFAGTGAPPTAVRKLAFGGWMTMSAPTPRVLARLPLTWPMKTPVMERIMMTSMATARHADGNANRPVEQVAENQLVHKLECSKGVTGG